MADSSEKERIEKEAARAFAAEDFKQNIVAFRNSIFDLDPEYSMDNRHSPNMGIYIDTQMGDLEGNFLTAKEAAQKYKIEGGEERVNQIVKGINEGVQEAIKAGGISGKYLKKIMDEVPGRLEKARLEYKRASS